MGDLNIMAQYSILIHFGKYEAYKKLSEKEIWYFEQFSVRLYNLSWMFVGIVDGGSFLRYFKLVKLYESM